MDPIDQSGQTLRLRNLLVLLSLLFAILVARLFYLQIATFAQYFQAAEENRIAQKRIKAPRGRILARGGEVLAGNRTSYSLFLTRSIPRSDSLAVSALETALGMPGIKYSRKYRNIRLLRDVDFRAVAIVEERLKEEWPLYIEIELQREYPYGALASHLLGYMGELQEEELQTSRAKGYIPGDFVGKTGVEKTCEDHLRGEDGVRYVEVDARNRERREFPEREQVVQPGADLHLTIDFKTQEAAERALPDSLPGSVVALDPQTGAVLAMASKPNFDPNAFVSFEGQDERRRLLQSSDNPLLNRAIRGRYPPGSTMKMVAAVAAVETGVTDTLSTFPPCTGSLQVGNAVFHCHKKEGHGSLTLLGALEASCNIYFLHLARVLGMNTWWTYADKLGFGQATGIDLEPEEDKGLLPSRTYYERRGGWSMGHLMNLVIGQGELLVTPIQMSRYVAALANGGYLVTPHVYGPPPERQQIQGLSIRTLEIVKQGMRRVIYGGRGTGHRAQIDGIEVAGKSGTAQTGNKEDDNAWFVAFAPFDNPAIAVAVIVEGGGHGGAVAGPIARQVMAAFFGRQDEVDSSEVADTAPAVQPPAGTPPPVASPTSSGPVQPEVAPSPPKPTGAPTPAPQSPVSASSRT